MKKACQTIAAIGLPLLLMLGFAGPIEIFAQEPVKINLMASQPAYVEGDPIQIQIRVFNDNLNAGGSIDPVITRNGFFYQDFHLLITFIDPDGLPVVRKFVGPADEPGPPYRINGRDAVLAEIIPPDGDNSYVLGDARDYYVFTKRGWYTGQVLVPFDAFSEADIDESGNLVAYLDDPGLRSFNPLASNKIRFEIAPPEPEGRAAIHVDVRLIQVGKKDKSADAADGLVNAEVRLFKIADIPLSYYPINWKTYPVIWSYATAFRSTLTDGSGLAKFSSLPQDDYLILAQHKLAADFKNLGAVVKSTDRGWLGDGPIIEYLTVIQKADGKKLPGKTTGFAGSQLLVTEPEYVEWDSEQQVYPFVFETADAWEVTTSLSPPAGFKVDKKSISEIISDQVKVVEFVVSGDGKEWKETKVKHKVKHKNKVSTVDGEIGIKLSKKFAKAKGLGIYGHSAAPGPFKGGKKIGAVKQK